MANKQQPTWDSLPTTNTRAAYDSNTPEAGMSRNNSPPMHFPPPFWSKDSLFGSASGLGTTTQAAAAHRWSSLDRVRIRNILCWAALLVMVFVAGSRHGRQASSVVRSSSRLNALAVARVAPREKIVVLYAYHETELTRVNAEFFLAHAMNDLDDFVFIVNGEAELEFPTHLPNVKLVRRENTCYDLGSYGEVLEANERELVKKYDKHILLNGSIKGPFMPSWSNQCWTDAIAGRVQDEVKLVGMTMNCIEGVDEMEWLHISTKSEGINPVGGLRHIQGMLMATDPAGLELLLTPLGLSACHNDYVEAVDNEIRLTSLITSGGYKVEALMQLFKDSDDFAQSCTAPNPFDSYPGGMITPFETIFVKSRAGTPPELVDKYSHWARDYDSRQFCNP